MLLINAHLCFCNQICPRVYHRYSKKFHRTLEVVDKFCYLGDVIGKGGGAEEASRARVRCVWGKFRDLRRLLTTRGASLKVKGKIYRACVQREIGRASCRERV